MLLLPTWSILHARHWKMQIPHLARHCRVLSFDGRGNGRSDRPTEPEAYRTAEFTADALAVMDATGTQRAILVALSRGATWALELGAGHPDRVAGIVFIAPGLALGQSAPWSAHSFTERLDTTEGWARFNQDYWRKHYREFLEFFFAQMFSEPHSTKPIEDTVGWGLETDPETLIATQRASRVGGPVLDPNEAADLAAQLRCPVLVIHGDKDAIRPLVNGAKLAELACGELVILGGSGHAPHVRDPVRVNLLLLDFIRRSRP